MLGRELQFGGRTYAVIGVAEPAFTGTDFRPVDLWVPLAVAGADYFGRSWDRQRYSFWLTILAASATAALPPP